MATKKTTKPLMIRLSIEATEYYQKIADSDDRKLAYVVAKVVEKEYQNQKDKPA